jgi:multidrug efflux pump subunit AcrA (membrane-fusion protein)
MTQSTIVLPAMRRAGSTAGARRVAGIMSWLFLLLVGGLAIAPWVQTVSGNGRVIGKTPPDRQQTIAAPVEGRIVRWHVSEGSRVREGDLIAEIADNDPLILTRLQDERTAVMLRMEAAKNRVTSLESRIAQLDLFRKNNLQVAENRLATARDNVTAAEKVIVSNEATLIAARQNIERQQALVAKGLTAVRAVELAQQDVARAQAEVDRARANLGGAINERLARESELLSIESDFRTRLDDAGASLASARSDVANAQAELQRVDVRVARQTQQIVRAPREGTIVRLLAQPGSELLKASDPVAIFVPDSTDLIVELFVDGNDVPLIHRGDSVRLQFEGWPAIQFAGWPSVAVGTFGGKVLLVDATDNGMGKFRILVEPDEKDERWPNGTYLRQGVRANGWVLLRTVPLGFELWRQFNSFPPSLPESRDGLTRDSTKGGKDMGAKESGGKGK